MNRTPVQSTQITSVGYDPAEEKLEVEFRNGQVYRYDGVPPSTHKALMESPSMGQYFTRNIRNGFIFRKV